MAALQYRAAADAASGAFELLCGDFLAIREELASLRATHKLETRELRATLSANNDRIKATERRNANLEGVVAALRLEFDNVVHNTLGERVRQHGDDDDGDDSDQADEHTSRPTPTWDKGAGGGNSSEQAGRTRHLEPAARVSGQAGQIGQPLPAAHGAELAGSSSKLVRGTNNATRAKLNSASASTSASPSARAPPSNTPSHDPPRINPRHERVSLHATLTTRLAQLEAEAGWLRAGLIECQRPAQIIDRSEEEARQRGLMDRLASEVAGISAMMQSHIVPQHDRINARMGTMAGMLAQTNEKASGYDEETGGKERERKRECESLCVCVCVCVSHRAFLSLEST